MHHTTPFRNSNQVEPYSSVSDRLYRTNSMQRGDNLEMSQREGKLKMNFSKITQLGPRNINAFHWVFTKEINMNFQGYVKNHCHSTVPPNI